MSDLDLTAIGERADAAVRGPWHVEYFGDSGYPQRIANDAAVIVADTHEGGHPARTAEFIAAARSDVPTLIAEVERLRVNVAKLLASKGTSWADGYETGCGVSHSLGCDAVAAQRDALVEEVGRLRLEVANLTAAIDGDTR